MPTQRASKCKHRFRNPKADLECTAWCVHAEECAGVAPPRDEAANLGGGSLAGKLLQAVKEQCESQPDRITHAMVVFQHAKQLLAVEGGDPRVVFAAALMLEIERLDDADLAGRENDVATRVRRTLEEIGLDADVIERVGGAMASDSSGTAAETVESRIVRDAHRLADLGLACLDSDGQGPDADVLDSLSTETARARARSLFG